MGFFLTQKHTIYAFFERINIKLSLLFSSQSIPNGVLSAADSSHNIALDRGGSCPPSAAVTPATTPVGSALNNLSEYTVTITSDEFIYAKVSLIYITLEEGVRVGTKNLPT